MKVYKRSFGWLLIAVFMCVLVIFVREVTGDLSRALHIVLFSFGIAGVLAWGFVPLLVWCFNRD